MTEILTQDELNALLSAIATGEVDSVDYVAARERRKVKIYDFRRPDKFSREQIRTLQMIHETFARLAATTLSARLRSQVSVHVASVDQLTFEEFIRSIPNPATMAVINMDPLAGSAVMELVPVISFVIIDRLFGGQGEVMKLNRELTDIEMSVMEGVIVQLLGGLRESWSLLLDLRPRLGNIETNPNFAQIVPPNDMVVLITLETKVGEVEGMSNLCIPYITIEPLLEKLRPGYWFTRPRGEVRPAPLEERALMESTLRQCALFALPGGITLRSLGRMRKGMRLMLPGNATASVAYEPAKIK